MDTTAEGDQRRCKQGPFTFIPPKNDKLFSIEVQLCRVAACTVRDNLAQRISFPGGLHATIPVPDCSPCVLCYVSIDTRPVMQRYESWPCGQSQRICFFSRGQ